MSTRVSVVIPVWDDYAGQGLRDAAASVLEQRTPVEVIVVDNASVTALPALGPVELVTLRQRHTTGAARNAGLERVRTPYVVFLDADDLLLPGALSALVDGLDRDGRCSAYALSIIDGATGRRHRSPRRLARLLSGVPVLFALVNTIWSLLPTQGATIMRTADARACGGYADSDRGEDWVLAISLAFRGRVRFDPRAGLRYRARADSPGRTALSGPVLLANAARVRDRVREDPSIPAWTRAIVPLLGLAQWIAARGAYPGYRSVRALVGGGTSD